MDSKGTSGFPLYRKFADGSSWFVVHAPDHMTQYQRMGSRWLLHEVHARIHPDRVLIADVVACEGGRWLVVDTPTFESFLQTVGNV